MNTTSIENNKKTLSSLSLILILAMTLMAIVQPSLAQVGISQPEKTVGYISVAPTLVGVGQEATVNLWIVPLPTSARHQSLFSTRHHQQFR